MTTSTITGTRLTHRGRVAVIVALLFMALCLLALRSGPAASTDVAHHMRTGTVVVTPGETVWDVARRLSPQADPRTVVDEIERLNNLGDEGSVRVGQPLLVPTR